MDALNRMLPTHSVGAGSYLVSKAKNLRLEAHLGTCVGVTLCDAKNKVGGLIHLLLPEPVGYSPALEPVRYANLGLPLFIEELLDAGAEPEQLAAVVAGGALVGPISNQDLSLDIGGRTTEVVEEVLALRGIPIIRSETGGYFTCRLVLNLANFRSAIEPLGPEGEAGQAEPCPISKQELDNILRRIKPIPQIALKLIRMIPDPNVSLAEIADEVRKDQTISAKVINLCNSPFFKRAQEVESIDRALVVLGEKHLLKLFLSASLQGLLEQEAGGYSLCRGGLYHHAVGTALVAEQLARNTSAAPPDVAYTAGLIHDIGKVALDQYLAQAAPLFYRRSHQNNEAMIEVEREVLGLTHTEVGGLMAKLWGLPESLAQAIIHHHYPENAPGDSALVHLVYLADLLLSRFKVGWEMENMNTHSLEARLNHLGLGLSDFPELVDSLPREIFSMEATGTESDRPPPRA